VIKLNLNRDTENKNMEKFTIEQTPKINQDSTTKKLTKDFESSEIKKDALSPEEAKEISTNMEEAQQFVNEIKTKLESTTGAEIQEMKPEKKKKLLGNFSTLTKVLTIIGATAVTAGVIASHNYGFSETASLFDISEKGEFTRESMIAGISTITTLLLILGTYVNHKFVEPYNRGEIN
jgi:hypothetical protein